MALYSRRMQIEQNFRDDKSPRFGFGLRLSRSGKGRLEVLNMVAAMASLVMWLAGYRAERQCLHRHYQASSVRHKRVLSYLSLAEEVIRHEPDKVRRLNIGNEMKKLGKSTVIWSWWHDHITGDQPTGRGTFRCGFNASRSDAQPGNEFAGGLDEAGFEIFVRLVCRLMEPGPEPASGTASE